ncbi:dihydrolipoamide acetyltransferase, E2 component [Pontimonas salivibrio]|uniref:Dihydrolipoamide acetyltransferase component of pyruvate dehydrogenase complex n=1 Tax=Pontimonas salivibrio TaxID=1159327 RepID=A0A2L2BRY4_9MICO|nr:dihydrolipoamide acetyltransferase family protein [Pontimonas salivibrio]AVG24436.1 dihydrolipoamide acetyltransferase, E2 component [Pontimonas salivibrio]
MAIVIRMPEVLAGAVEAVLSQWMMQEGSEVSVGDTLAEIETEKANVDYQAEEQGRLARVLVGPGDTVEVGAPIAVFAAPGDTDDDIDAALAAAGIGQASGGSEPSAAAPADEPAEAPTVDPQETPKGAPAEPSPAQSGPVPPVPGGRIYASPLVRKRAREAGIDLSQVTGTGPGGRIVKKDLDAVAASGTAAQGTSAPAHSAVAAPTVPAAAMVSGDAEYTDRPHSGMRKAIARRLTESKTTVPHFYVSADCRVEKLLAARTEMNEATGVKISVNDWVIKAVAKAMLDVPDANVIWREDALRYFNRVDIAIAVSVEGGLLTPVLRGVEAMGLTEINSQVNSLASKAREGRITQAEIEGGSFSISNLGMYGTDAFQAILNPPQSGILAVGAARDAAVVEQGSLVAGKIMTVNLSADHRAVDGALAAEWMKAFRHYIEHPLALLA